MTPPVQHTSRRRWLTTVMGLAAAPLSACGGGSDLNPAPPPAPTATRQWQMGFSPNPPRFTVESVLQGIELWSPRAEMFIIHEELPWADLLAGMPPADILARDKVPLVRLLRAKGLQLVFMGDLNDGTARERDAPTLLAAGRSITEPAVQRLYRDYMLAVDRVLAPQVLGLVAESNLIRQLAPALYPAIRQTANDTAAALRATGSTTTLMASVQVEAAWGRLLTQGTYVGCDTDFADFAFMQRLGLSSYPYFAWTDPQDLPLDYFSRLLAGRSLPAMVVEGGWASTGDAGRVSSPAMQARWVARQAELLDAVHAHAWLHLQFADIDLEALAPALRTSLAPFATIGLTDSNFVAKPALAVWDSLLARRLLA
jgi:hypothetical protein